MEHLKKYWWVYLLIIIAIIIYINRDKIFKQPSSTTPPVGGNGDSLRSASTVSLNSIPSNRLSEISSTEKQIIQSFFNEVNAFGSVTQRMIDNVNNKLMAIGSTTSFIKNDPTAKAKCKEGYNCWSVNLLIFTMCHCKSYPV